LEPLNSKFLRFVVAAFIIIIIIIVAVVDFFSSFVCLFVVVIVRPDLTVKKKTQPRSQMSLNKAEWR